MKKFLFTSDMHGNISQYNKIFDYASANQIPMIILGGDLAPKNAEYRNPLDQQKFFNEFLFPLIKNFSGQVLMIMGNDDFKSNHQFLTTNQDKIGYNIIDEKPFIDDHGFCFIGYSYVPYTPFQWKDWEKRDLASDSQDNLSPVTRIEGFVSNGIDPMVPYNILDNLMDNSIECELQSKTNEIDFNKLILISHTPPHNTDLDCALIGDNQILHVGSRAVHKFISQKQPLLSLHGHIHETVTASGNFMINIGNSICASSGNEHTSPSPYVLIIEDKKISRICL